MTEITNHDRQPILSVKNLRVTFVEQDTITHEVIHNEVVHGVSFDVFPGEVLSIVGESGSGKSVSVMALMRLLPSNKTMISADECIYRGRDGEIDLLTYPIESLYQIRGGDIGVIFQDPMLSLNPVHRVGRQISEVFELHRPDLSRSRYREEIIRLFNQVGIKHPEDKINVFPHQLSGGMRQRVMIAIALAGRPKILIADEPTTSLDVTIQAMILELIEKLQLELGMSMIFISHDLAVVRSISDDIAVMYEGNIVECGESERVIVSPQHEYTQSLLASSSLVR